MKEDKMENIHLIFKFLWYSVLFCIWGVSCTSSGTYKKTQMDIYMQYYDFIIDSLSKNPSYVCTRTARQMSVATDSVAYYHYLVLLTKHICLNPRWIRLNLAWIERKYFAMELNRHR